MRSYGLWFEISLRALAAVGVAAIFGLGIFGIGKLIKERPLLKDGPGQTAAVASAQNKSPASSTESVAAGSSATPEVSSGAVAGEAQTKIYPRSSAFQVLPNGVSDLAAQIINTGVIDDASGEFSVATSVPRNQQAAIVFDIVNIGTAVSDSWNFSANLPSPDGYFNSETQPPLKPGDRIRFTIGFKNLNQPGENKAILTVDPKNAIRDANRNNDYATATLIRGY